MMPSIETNEESFADMQKDLLDELDRIQLKPSVFVRILKPTLAFTIPGLIVSIVTSYFIDTVLVYLAFAFGIFFTSVGILFLIIGVVTRMSTDKNVYTFTKSGLVIQSRKGNEKYFRWEEILDIELIGKGEGNRTQRLCIVKTKDDKVVIRINKFYETSEDSYEPDNIIEIISMYYESKKYKCYNN
jgi:hypothetical protein